MAIKLPRKKTHELNFENPNLGAVSGDCRGNLPPSLLTDTKSRSRRRRRRERGKKGGRRTRRGYVRVRRDERKETAREERKRGRREGSVEW